MFENEEKQLREVRSKLEELPIPNEQLNDAIQQGFIIADSEWRAKRRKRRKSLMDYCCRCHIFTRIHNVHPGVTGLCECGRFDSRNGKIVEIHSI